MSTHENISIQSFKEGNFTTFKTIFKRYYKVLCSYVYDFIKDPVATDDLVQDLFVHLWEKRNDFDCQEKIASFLFVSARNACINLTRHEKMKKEKLKEYSIDIPHHEPETYLLIEEFDKKLDHWLQTLPPECRKIMELSIDGKRNSEISELLNLSINTIKNQKVKGYKILRTLYKDEYGLLALYIMNAYLFK